MAESFAIGTNAPLLQAPQAVQLGRMGSTGGGGERRAQQLVPVDVDRSTMDAVLKIGSAVLEPALRRREAEMFLEGAQRVAQGEALKDIVDSQPWYSRIFGEGATVQGARTIAQISQVDKYTADLYGDMDRLQTMGREEVGKEVNSKMLQFLTGDAVADAAIQQKMVEASGPFFNAHAKANYKWVQGTMQSQVSGMMRSAGEHLQAANKQRLAGTMTDEDFQRHKQSVANAMLPLEGQSAESYWSAIESSTIDAMANGNHHIAGMVFGSGLLDSAPDEVRKKLIDARQTYEARTIERDGYLEYGAVIGQLQGQAKAGVISPAEMSKRVVEINEDFRRRTGIESDLLSRKTFTSMLAGNYSAIYRRAEQNAKEAAKDASKGQEDLHRLGEIHQALLTGAGDLVVSAGHKRAEVDAVFWGILDQAAASGADYAPLVINNYNNGNGYVNTQLQNKMQSALRAAKGEGYSGKAFDQAYAMTRQLTDQPGGQAAAMAYLGEADGLRMLEYDALVKAQVAPEFAYQMAFGKPLDTTRKSTDKDVLKRLQSVVEDQQPGWWSQKFGSSPMNPAGQRIVANTLGQSYDLLAGGAIGDEAAFKVAMDVARQKLDIVGPFAYTKRPGQAPMSALLGTDDDAAGAFFEEIIREDAKKQGVKLELAGGLGPAKRHAEDLGWMALSPLNALSWMDHVGRKAPDIPIMRGVDRIDPQTGLTYTTFSVTVVDEEGNMAQIPYDSRDLRSRFEKSSHFK